MKKRYTQLVIATAISGLLFACSKNEDTVASVDNKNISKSTFNSYLAFKHIDKNSPQQVKAYLTQYVNREGMASAIEKSNFLDEKTIAIELNEFKKEMLISRYFDKFLKEKVSDNAIRNYYATNIDKFSSKKANVAHILIRTNKNMSETERKAKYTLAHEVYSKLKAGEDFSTIVTQYSEDTISAKKAGELGWINEGAIDPVFSKMVFTTLKKDEISTPFQTSFGFHIVKLLAEPSVVKKPLEKVKGDIRFQLRKKAKEEEIKRLMTTVHIKQG